MTSTNLRDVPTEELKAILANPATPECARFSLHRELRRRVRVPSFDWDKGLKFADEE